MTRLPLLLLLLVVLGVMVSCCVAIIQVDPVSQQMVDQYGRHRIWHGVNAVYKQPPWHPEITGFDPQRSIGPQDIANLKQWGFNFVRLGMMWPGVYPAKGQVNTTYLDTMGTLIKNLGDAGIYTLVDFHQDLMSRYYCGEGAPDWAVQPMLNHTLPFPEPVGRPLPKEANGYPVLEDCLKKEFAEYYVAESVGELFESIYENKYGLQDEFASFWDTVSKYYAAYDTVVGYELFNEPWGGNIYTNPDLLNPELCDRINLFPLYERLNSVIRANDPNHIIFFEKALNGLELAPTGFETGPGGSSSNSKQVYSYHVYCGFPKESVGCDIETLEVYKVAMEDLQKLGCGGMMTEFGAATNATKVLDELEWIMSLSDDNLQGYAYWQFKLFKDLTTQGPAESFYNAEGQLELNKVATLSRTYAPAVAGTILTHKYVPKARVFTLRFRLKASITQPTEIYLNEAFFYQKGFVVEIEPAGSLTWSKPEPNRVHLTKAASTPDGTVITVKVSPEDP